MKSYLQAFLFIVGVMLSAVSAIQIINDRRLTAYTYTSFPLSSHEKTYAIGLGAGLILAVIGVIIMYASYRLTENRASNKKKVKPYIDFKNSPFYINKVFAKQGPYLEKMAERLSTLPEEKYSGKANKQAAVNKDARILKEGERALPDMPAGK